MVPTINKNDIVFVQSNGGVGGSSSFASLKRGDIIAFTSPTGNESIVHRIVDIKLDSSGNRIIKTKGDANPSSYLGLDYPIREQNYMRKVIYIFPPIFGLFLDLTNPPFYPIIVASVIAVIFYLYKNKEGEKLEERKREQEPEQQEPEQQEQTIAIRLRQSAFTATAILLVAILLADSYILVNPYIPVSLGHNVGALASAKIAAIGDNNNLYIIWNDYSARGKYDIMLAKSTDGGNSFGKSINLSDDKTGISGFPNIAVSTNNTIYVSWIIVANNTRLNHTLYFTKSTNGGNRFIQSVNLVREEVLGIPVIAASGKTNLYIIWAANFTGNYIIRLKKSADGGNAFSDPVNLTSRNGLSSSLV
jgi:signal peptidase I